MRPYTKFPYRTEFPDSSESSRNSPTLEDAFSGATGASRRAERAASTAGKTSTRTRSSGRSSAPDPDAYDRSVERLRTLDPVRVRFAHDPAIWERG
jgi:hypothetical protein